MSFRKVDLRHATFGGTNIERFDFVDVAWPEALGRFCLYDELALGADTSGNRIWRVSENYRQIVLNYEARRNYELAESFHVGEMEMARRESGWRLLGSFRGLFNLRFLYNLLSVYGTSHGRAGGVLIAMVILFALAFLHAGLATPKAHVDYEMATSQATYTPTLSERCEDFMLAIVFTLEVATLQKDRVAQPQSLESRVLVAIATLSLAGQAALFLFAVRRRFRRASV